MSLMHRWIGNETVEKIRAVRISKQASVKCLQFSVVIDAKLQTTHLHP